MEKIEFRQIRKRLGKTQKQISSLLGTSLKTIHSYEQGWRSIPPRIERSLFFFLINRRGKKNNSAPCWEENNCHRKEDCPAWEFQSGHQCWFLNGTFCDGTSEPTYKSNLGVCRTCKVFKSQIK